MDIRTLAFVALTTLAVSALPPVAAESALDHEVAELNPCRPYPEDPSLYDEAWCTAKGSGKAVVLFVDNVADGNYTAIREYYRGAHRMKGQVEDCVSNWGNSTNCPNQMLGDPGNAFGP